MPSLLQLPVRASSCSLQLALALSTTVIASPALARDGSPYVGVDLGGLILEDKPFEFSESDDDSVEFKVDHKVGYDVGAFAGYDFGWVRVEGEIAYKRASAKAITLIAGDPIDIDGHSSALSGMVNALLDFESDRWGGFVGPGIGVARVSTRFNGSDDDEDFEDGFKDSDSAWAWQVVAGVRYAVSPNMDVGVKYRLFNAPGLHFPSDISSDKVDGDWRSHSLLASLAFNFGAPPVVVAPPPPVVVEQAPPPPATQTCPDGSVILATDVCPAPPPPPPGERG